MELTNSKRVMHSASYVTTQLNPLEQAKFESEAGSGLPKANLLRAMALNATELTTLREVLARQEENHSNSAQMRLLSIAEGLIDSRRRTSIIALASAMAPIPYKEVDQFYESVAHVRGPSLVGDFILELSKRRRKVSPIGSLHLERIEMYPAGIQRGELVFTVPMAPGETVAISHREWSTTTREFEDIVQDYFESYSERGVAEKSDTAMSSESESKHSSIFNFGASLSGTEANLDRYGKIEFGVPPGYWLKQAAAKALYSDAGGAQFTWYNGVSWPIPGTPGVAGNLSDFTNAIPRPSGSLAVTYSYRNIHTAALTLELTYERAAETTWAWQRDAWNAIKASFEAQEAVRRAQLQQERDDLWRQLNGKDTLSLRRLEREELMRLVMQWLLGPDSELHPGGDRDPPPLTKPLQETLSRLILNESRFYRFGSTEISPTFEGVSQADAYEALLFGEFVKFMHQAIEWENLLYFLYPYFWGSEAVGKDKLLFAHADPEHERFLRAGYVRVVLPVRPGFERDFTQLVEQGTLAGNISSPYISIGEDIANFARTNYAGVPPANPENYARPLLYPEQRETWGIMQDAMKAIDQFKGQNGKYPTALSELASGEPVDAWGNPLVYRMPGLGADYDLVSLGADNVEGGDGLNADISSSAGASLMGTWFDYTPTSALDIEVNTPQTNFA